MDTITRFAAKVKQMESGCHEWQSVLSRTGYGKFFLTGKQDLAHRVSWLLHKGEIPEGLCVLHRCDNRRCVNPEHLFIGTDRDNVLDMHAKGRFIGNRKISDGQVREVRELLKTGLSQQRIADRIGISQMVVSRIKLGHRQYLTRI